MKNFELYYMEQDANSAEYQDYLLNKQKNITKDASNVFTFCSIFYHFFRESYPGTKGSILLIFPLKKGASIGKKLPL